MLNPIVEQKIVTPHGTQIYVGKLPARPGHGEDTQPATLRVNGELYELFVEEYLDAAIRLWGADRLKDLIDYKLADRREEENGE